MSVFMCQIDETVQGSIDETPHSYRAELLNIWGIVEAGKWYFRNGPLAPTMMKNPSIRTIQSVLVMLRYQSSHPARSRRMPMQDMEGYVEMWVRIIRGLATAHDKKELDNCEFEMESALGPILTAPVKRLREFYERLCTALRNDPSIPFFVWSMFLAWGEGILKKATNDEVIELKNELAKKIARMVEADVRPDLKDAIAGALRWRSEKDLATMETHLDEQRKNGKKGRARLVGKESCLFLQIGEHTVML